MCNFYDIIMERTRRRLLGINFANTGWTLWPEDDAHRDVKMKYMILPLTI